jgi:hypothetical protein
MRIPHTSSALLISRFPDVPLDHDRPRRYDIIDELRSVKNTTGTLQTRTDGRKNNVGNFNNTYTIFLAHTNNYLRVVDILEVAA